MEAVSVLTEGLGACWHHLLPFLFAFLVSYTWFAAVWRRDALSSFLFHGNTQAMRGSCMCVPALSPASEMQTLKVQKALAGFVAGQPGTASRHRTATLPAWPVFVKQGVGKRS